MPRKAFLFKCFSEMFKKTFKFFTYPLDAIKKLLKDVLIFNHIIYTRIRIIRIFNLAETFRRPYDVFGTFLLSRLILRQCSNPMHF